MKTAESIRHAARLLAVLCVVWAAAPAVPAWSAPAPVAEVLRAKRLELVDDQGRVRALWSLQSSGPALELKNESGQSRAALRLADGQPQLTLLGSKGESVFDVMVSSDARAMLVWYKDEKAALLAGLAGNGKPVIYLLDPKAADAKTRLALGLTPQGAGSMLASDEQGRERLRLSPGLVPEKEDDPRKGPSSLRVYGEDGSLIWKAP